VQNNGEERRTPVSPIIATFLHIKFYTFLSRVNDAPGAEIDKNATVGYFKRERREMATLILFCTRIYQSELLERIHFGDIGRQEILN